MIVWGHVADWKIRSQQVLGPHDHSGKLGQGGKYNKRKWKGRRSEDLITRVSENRT
jgi:hypothetical protein